MKKRIMYILLYVLLLFLMINSVSSGKVIYNFRITGESMLPSLNPNIKMYENLLPSYYKVIHMTSKEDLKNLTVGEVICFNYDKRRFLTVGNPRYICHRIIYYNDDMVCTEGDNNKYPDRCIEWKYVALKVLI